MTRKVSLVTGSATGLGNHIVRELASLSHDVVINYRSSSDEAYQLAEQIKLDYGVNVLVVKADLSVPSECENLYNSVMDHFGKIDVFVNAAGPYYKPRQKVVDYSIEDWSAMINGNLHAFFYLAKQIVPQMRERKWGRIITFGFDRSDTAPSWVSRGPFAAAKVALTSLTKTMAIEEAPNGITVNMVCPGDIYGEAKESNIADFANVPDSNPVGRRGTGEDISRVVKFLVDDNSSFLTGCVIPVTGGADVLGKYMWRPSS